MTSTSSVSKLLFALYLVLSLLLIFYLPTLVDNRYVFSDSYFFGYNNRLGIVLLLLFAVIGAVWAPRLGMTFPVEGVPDRVSRKMLLACVATGLLLCAGMYVLTARPGSFGESAYLINRIELAAHGLRPYQDFEYAYGASFVYVPLWFSRWLHLSVPNGYYLFWLLNVLSGIWLLAEVLNGLDFPGRYRNQIFLMYCVGPFVGIVTTGVNYAGLRYFAGPWLALLLYRAIRRGRTMKQAGRGWLTLGVLGVAPATLLVLLLSPELGVAFGFGMAVFLPILLITDEDRFWLAPYGAMLVCLAGLVWEANRLDVFRTFKMFAEGGINFPIVPAPHILLLFLVVFVGCSYLVFWLARGRFDSNTSCLLAIGVPSLPAALGHGDPGHVIFNGVVFFLVGFLWASNQPRVWRWYRAAFLLVFVCLAALTFLYGYIGQLSRTALAFAIRTGAHPEAQVQAYYRKMMQSYGPAVAEQKVAEVKMMSQEDATRDGPWRPEHTSGVVEAPFGYSVSQNQTYIDEGYYAGLTNAFDTESIATKIEELKRHGDRELLVPQYTTCFYNADGERKFISILFVYPFRRRVVHEVNFYDPLCKYILQHYSVRVSARPETYGYAIWSPKN